METRNQVSVLDKLKLPVKETIDVCIQNWHILKKSDEMDKLTVQ